MKKGALWAGLIALAVVAAGASAFLIGQLYQSRKAAEEPADEIKTFAAWTNHEQLSQVPAMIVKGVQIGKAVDVGAGNCMIDMNGATAEDYTAYLALLQEQGFELLADNGTDGINAEVFTANLKKDEISVAAIYVTRLDKVYVIAGRNQKTSQFLKYDATTTAEPVVEQTMMALCELRSHGNSFVFRLKNGHFLVNDGGENFDFIYLIEYLESFMPEGEKPVIDCWIISHAHSDHMGVFYELGTHPEYAERLIVNEILYSQPNAETVDKYKATNAVAQIYVAAGMFRTSEGTATPVIRPITGQKYYFCDIVMEVFFSQELLPLTNYSEDLNDSSTWLMYNVEGQKILLAGDGDYGAMHYIMRMYDTSYFNLDIFINLHHGINVFDEFTDYLTIKTLLVPYYDAGFYPVTVANGTRWESQDRLDANEHLLASVQEAMTGTDGTLELSFPYSVGTAKRLERNKWLHHGGEDLVGFPSEIVQQQG